MSGGHRPEDAGGGKAGLFGGRKDVGALYGLCEPVPGDVFQHARVELGIVVYTVFVGIASGRHRRVRGICDRRVDRAGAFDHRAA